MAEGQTEQKTVCSLFLAKTIEKTKKMCYNRNRLKQIKRRRAEMKTLVKIPPEMCGMSLRDALALFGCELTADCGGRGTCGKCMVLLVDGELADKTGTYVSVSNAKIKACGMFCTDRGATVEVDALSTLGKPCVYSNGSEEIVFAVDVGTTTLAASAVDAADGRMLAEIECKNPQCVYGADVMSRISAAEKHLTVMNEMLIDRLDSMILSLFDALGRRPCPTVGTLAANPTMTALSCGISPSPIGSYPFELPFEGTRTITLPHSTVRLTTLPLSSAFIGSDVLVGATLHDLDRTNAPTLFADLGTNGEIILSNKGRIYAASAAAGPALEGAGITCGMAATDGAIVSMTRSPDGRLIPRTLGDIPPVGISASGLCDLIAVLIELGEIEPSGALSTDPFYIDRDHRVFVTAEDVRAFMLAKAAFRAACDLLTKHAGLSLHDIDTLIVAGGIGQSLNRFSAASVGLFSPMLAPKLKFVGNSSLLGAARAAWDGDFARKVEKLSKRTVTLSLADSSLFKDRFIGEMHF